jgi:signal transduction histidine kinase
MLRTRLFLNLVPFVVILLATGFYAVVLFSRLATSVDTTVAEDYRSVIAAQRMTLALAGIDREAWAASAATTNTDDSRALAQHQNEFEQNLALQLKSTSLHGERDLNQQLEANYRLVTQALVNLRSLARPELRHQLYEREVAPRALRIKVLLDKILDLNQQAILATNQRVQQITREVTRLMVLGMGVALVAAGFASYRLSRSILRPIQLLTQSTRELGEGKLNQPVPIVSRDELGQLAQAFNQMAAQLQEYRQSTTDEIVRLHRTMETTLASFPDPIFVLNQQGHIELQNPAAAELASGLHLDGQLPGRLQPIARKALETGEAYLPQSFDAVISHRVRRAEKFFLPRVLTMRDKENAPFGVAVVLNDVTRFRLLDGAKTHLVATVSHELKTPLTSVRMALHILRESTVGPLTAKQEELVQTACTDTERLLGILNNLLDLAMLEEGNAELAREPVPPAELLSTVMDQTADGISAKGLKLECRVDPGLPDVLVDRQRINHVFANLLTNAIKHSPEGREIRLRASRAEDRAVRFTVSDSGPGIPEQYQSRIFERFFRVPGQRSNGAGLGLSIAKEIAVAHGGRIGVQSAPGSGATFYVVLKATEPQISV